VEESIEVEATIDRSSFLLRVYGHLLGAVAVFVLIETWLFQTGMAYSLARSLLGVNWMLVLGGLIDDALRNNEQKVPLLGDIPGIGALFRSTKTDTVKRNLMIFIRATVVKDGEKARILSQNKYNFMRDLQLQKVEEEAVGPLLVPYE